MKENKLDYIDNGVVNVYIVYKLNDFNDSEDSKIRDTTNPDFTAQNCLFVAVKITTDADRSNYKYSGYVICFNAKGSFSSGNITNGKNVIILGVNMSFSAHERNRKNKIYVLGKDFIQELTTVEITANSDDRTKKGTTISAEKIYKTSMTEPRKKFVLSLHCNGDISYLFVNGVEQLKLKTDANEIQKLPLTLGNISSDWSLTNSTKTGLFGNVYDFAVHFLPINDVKTIYDILRYLMTKHNI